MLRWCVVVLVPVIVGCSETRLTTDVTADRQRREGRTAGDPFQLAEALRLPGGDPLERMLSDAWLAAVTSGGAEETQSLEQWARDNTDGPPEMLSFAHQSLAQLYNLRGLFPESAEAHTAAIDADPAGATQDMRDAHGLARVAAPIGPIRSAGARGALVEATVDLANLIRVPVRIGESHVPLIIDTGAEVSVLAESVAHDVGAVFLEGDVVVGTTTENVSGRIAVVDQLFLAEMIFENVPFLVLSDDSLIFADGKYFVDGILGLQVFRVAERMAWLDLGASLAFGDKAPRVEDSGFPIFWHESGLGLGLPFNGSIAPALLDSGASGTRFTSRTLDGMPPEARDAVVDKQLSRTSMGGEETTTIRLAAELSIRVGDVLLKFEEAIIAPSASYAQGSRDIAVIGLSTIRRLQSLVVDFTTMRYTVAARDETLR